jgi:hypothetical protein
LIVRDIPCQSCSDKSSGEVLLKIRCWNSAAGGDPDL